MAHTVLHAASDCIGSQRSARYVHRCDAKDADLPQKRVGSQNQRFTKPNPAVLSSFGGVGVVVAVSRFFEHPSCVARYRRGPSALGAELGAAACGSIAVVGTIGYSPHAGRCSAGRRMVFSRRSRMDRLTAFRQSLAATIAWCGPSADPQDPAGCLRTPGLHPGLLARRSHQVHDVISARAFLLQQRDLPAGLPGKTGANPPLQRPPILRAGGSSSMRRMRRSAMAPRGWPRRGSSTTTTCRHGIPGCPMCWMS